jgi:hypothetical protein
MSSLQLTVTRALRKFKDRSFELPMTRNYIAAWGFQEAVREILQNALDSESEFKWDYTDNVLRIISEDSKLDTKSLLLGGTTKANDETSIGSFGEGYKLALLVLTRNNYPVRVFNNGVLWTPCFRKSPKFGEETLCIDETWVENPPKGLVFEIGNVPEYRYEDICKRCLPMQNPASMGNKLYTLMGEIYTDHPGALYVNGLFVCKTDMKNSYNVKPEFIKLERDRQTVGTWDLYNLSKEMWFLTERFEDIANMIENSAQDMCYAEYNTPEVLKDFLYQHWKSKNPGKIGVSNSAEMKLYIANGMTNIVIVNQSTHSILSQHPEYKANAALVKQPLPQEILQKWYDKLPEGLLPDGLDVEFGDIMRNASNWR